MDFGQQDTLFLIVAIQIKFKEIWTVIEIYLSIHSSFSCPSILQNLGIGQVNMPSSGALTLILKGLQNNYHAYFQENWE